MDWILNSPFWEYLTLGAVIVGLLAAILFVVRFQYEVGFGWWKHRNGEKNHFGRYLMMRKLLLSALFTLVLVNHLAGFAWAGREALTAILMVAFALQTFVPYRLLIEAQRAHKKEARDDDGVRRHERPDR